MNREQKGSCLGSGVSALLQLHCKLISVKRESGPKWAKRRKEAEGPTTVLGEERLWVLDRQCQPWVGLGCEGEYRIVHTALRGFHCSKE